eukprot:TRINITY_DN1232_c0_g1_i7.p1 TRINITY_DN1232_c0_g1~~TRINITY_DN1232_c0_g1_i7.p1  ORF type:complete len:186 (-),score=15.09 TRINITY_DN1232_c0_g1_i7:172-729(-)
MAHQFYFLKHNKPRSTIPMKSSKASFPITKGGFDICVPSKRTEAAIISLFFHVLQQSPILRLVILSESTLASPSQTSSLNYLSSSSSWNWLRTAVRIINELKLVPNICNNSLLWAVPLECEVITSIDLSTGEVSCMKRLELKLNISFPFTNPGPFQPSLPLVTSLRPIQSCLEETKHTKRSQFPP